MNEIEFIPTSEGLLVAVSQPDGTIRIFGMEWEDFYSLREACQKEKL